MHTENSIIIRAPLEKIFETAANLSLWPDILPHYRWIRYLQQLPGKNVVVMAARRNWIPVRWTSEQEIDRANMEIRFHHIKAFTKGMRVVWTFTPTPSGVVVHIRHDLKPTIPIIGVFIANEIIGKFFVSSIANRTLMHIKKYVEERYGT